MHARALITGCLAASLSLGTVLGITPASVRAAAQRPDIIAIMVDDLGYLPGNEVLERMPNIRQTFVEGGLELQRMVGETPLCSPGRASLLTGQHTLHHGVTANNRGVIDPRRSVAWAVERSGYHTALVGKYFVRWDDGKPAGWSSASLFHDPEQLAARSSETITAAPVSEPLFAWIATTAPHRCHPGSHPDSDCRLPYVPPRLRDAPECEGIGTFKPPSYRTWQRPRPFPRNMPFWPDGWPLQQVCESMLQVDEALAAIVAAQAERGRPAYYFLFTDNGMSWGQKGYPAKRVPTATRMPMYVAGPRVPRGSSSGKLLSSIDLAPTMARLAGAPMPWVDGRPFTKLLRGETYDGRKRVLEHSLTPKLRWSAVRSKNWRYIRWPDGRRQLYHLRKDPWELRNLAAKKPQLVKRMDRELTGLLKRSRS